jgi:hypothetical protein
LPANLHIEASNFLYNPACMIVPFETLQAHCLRFEEHLYLVQGAGAEAFLAAGQGTFAPVYVRYAFLCYGTLRPFFVTLAADDRGQLYRGFEAIDWIANSGLLFPRSDAEGVYADGSDDLFPLKELDLGVSILAYASRSETEFPGAQLYAALEFVSEATFALAPGGNFPARLLSAIPAIQVNAALPPAQLARLIPQVAASPRIIGLDLL